MMKRAMAALTVFCLLLAACAVAEPVTESKEDLRGNGIVITRHKEISENEKQKQAIDYPSFAAEDETLQSYLDQTITQPFLGLRKLGQMAEDSAYAEGNKDFIRSGYFASLDFPSLLSVEMTVSNRAAGAKTQETLFMYRIVDLAAQKQLSVYDLFVEDKEQVDAALRQAVYEIGQKDGNVAASIQSTEEIPQANSYFLMKTAFRCIFAAGKVKKEAAVIDIPWGELGLTQSAVFGTTSVQEPLADAPGQNLPDKGETLSDLESILQNLMASDWQYGDKPSGLRFGQDGVLQDPNGAEAEFCEYYVDGDALVLVDQEGAENRAKLVKVKSGLLITFEDSSKGMLVLTPMAAAAFAPAPQEDVPQAEPTAAATPTPEAQTAEPLQANPQKDFSLPPVQTATPMPVNGDDVPVVDLLTRGLWKPMGSDGRTYYQFTPDGKLLVVNVEEYTVREGVLESESLSGRVILGGDTAFTLDQEGQLAGYVLNRSAAAVPGEEFVTPSPTPVATPTPTPEPTPTPSPTPEPTPTLSPYEVAKQQAPSLAALGDVSFDKIKTLKVYSAPSEEAYREDPWQVTTDETVGIYGIENGWVLVSYTIGNGSKGRVGYVETSTLAEPEKVANLGFSAIELTLAKDANATDDPLGAKGKITTLKKDKSVKLLAFMGSDWAYVETTYKSKICRLFIPQSSLMSE